MESLRFVAKIADKKKPLLIVSSVSVVIALTSFDALEHVYQSPKMLAVQLIVSLLVISWVLLSPNFLQDLEVEHAFDGTSFKRCYDNYISNSSIKKGVAKTGGMINVGRFVIFVAWLAAAVAFQMNLVHSFCGYPVSLVITSLIAWLSFALNFISFKLCFTFSWLIVDVQRSARNPECRIPFNVACPANTPGYVELRRSAMSLIAMYAAVSSLYVLATVFSGGWSNWAEWWSVGAFLTVVVSLVCSLVLCFVCVENLSSMRAYWQRAALTVLEVRDFSSGNGDVFAADWPSSERVQRCVELQNNILRPSKKGTVELLAAIATICQLAISVCTLWPNLTGWLPF